MKFTFNPKYFIVFTVLLLIEVCIAVFLKDGFIRFTVGDFLAVMLLYCLFKSFIHTHSVHIAIVALLMAYGIEILQLANLTEYGVLIEHKWVSLILGSHFSVQDLMAYSLGIVSVLYLDTYILNLNQHETTI